MKVLKFAVWGGIPYGQRDHPYRNLVETYEDPEPIIQAKWRICIHQNKKLMERIGAYDEALREDVMDILRAQILSDVDDLEDHFTQGFCLGVKLMIEVLTMI